MNTGKTQTTRTGTYFYSRYNAITGEFTRHARGVEVLDETGRSYLVRFTEHHADGSPPGRETWVRKKSVTLHEKRPCRPPREPAGMWLPYAD